jgi:hypothetical protein
VFGRSKADQRTLQVVAIPLRQQGRRLLVLHPFSHGFQPEPARQVDQRVHKGAIIARFDDVTHEGAVNLDDVHAELAQIAERGMAGAEIVDGDTAAAIAAYRAAVGLTGR